MWTQRDRPALQAPALHTLGLIARQPWRHCVASLRSAHWLASSLKLGARGLVSGCWPSCTKLQTIIRVPISLLLQQNITGLDAMLQLLGKLMFVHHYPLTNSGTQTHFTVWPLTESDGSDVTLTGTATPTSSIAYRTWEISEDTMSCLSFCLLMMLDIRCGSCRPSGREHRR